MIIRISCQTILCIWHSQSRLSIQLILIVLHHKAFLIFLSWHNNAHLSSLSQVDICVGISIKSDLHRQCVFSGFDVNTRKSNNTNNYCKSWTVIY